MNPLIKGGMLLLLCLLSTTSHAHNVVAGAYVDGMSIEGEIGFSNGEMVLPDVLVEVFDSAGVKLGEALTEADGLFSFTATTAQQHVMIANLGAGHVATIVVAADEFTVGSAPDTSPVNQAAKGVKTAAAAVTTATGTTLSANTAVAGGVSVAELESIVRKAVSQQVKPLQKELRAYKEKVMLRDIAGGLGFIFGLFGVAAWMAASKTSRQRPG